ncbi:aquaporin AQPAe.a-like isoform X1 [Pogonomyrmex barbatus]|uniref:Aquaporin AQPAe.a-like isoform X1 n=1 Tax=Pogonomyrmex barbatus TaxID=144034 RepID=A0A6I9WQA5_9HYME|nr:aquaporin AQPAe.a-like isoform X1 [Pogonomyrmex barbatus]XP_011633989.1 aquaporin AQPAe.a-like isoform X1 [Pogonomyrmex barbatus]
MEQNGISIISPSDENSVRKSKSIGITFRSNGTILSMKEKLKAPWLKKTEEDGTCWDKFLTILGELIGTAILIFLGCMACLGSMKPYTLGIGPSTIQISFAFGLAVMVAIQCVGHISGAHLNPAVTVAAVILGKKTFLMAGYYIIAQCLGSLLGFGLLKAITPPHLVHGGDSETRNFCVTQINGNLGVGHGIAAEAFATGILAFFACGSWDSRNAKNTDSTALKFGLCVTVLCLAFIPHTGCSLNPARTFGPALWNMSWNAHWVYWLGPIGGAIISAVIYRCLFLSKTKNQTDTMQNIGTFNGIET